MSTVENELQRLEGLLAELGFDLAASVRPGLSREELVRVVEAYAESLAEQLPDDLVRWYERQNGLSSEDDGRAGSAELLSLGPGDLFPFELERTVRILAESEPDTLDGSIVPLFGAHGMLYGYRLDERHGWHLSRWDEDTGAWSNPEVRDTISPSSAITTAYYSLTDWLAALNDALAAGRLIRVDGDRIEASSSEVATEFPWT